jgi:hypothetical protein
MRPYDYKNCQSLFGYAAECHIRSGGKCQLCGCGGIPLDFDLWRQMTVEHLIGESQGGYLPKIRDAVAARFPDISADARDGLARRLDALNTVTACQFCNSTTSRERNAESMSDLLQGATGSVEEVEAVVASALKGVLERKREKAQWKLASVREAFEREVRARIIAAPPTVQMP